MYHNFFSIQIDLFIKSIRDSNMDVVPIKILSRATLNRIINMSFTWFNIKAGYNNQLIKYRKTMAKHSQTLHFHQVYGVIVVILINTSNKYPITLLFDETIFKVTITLKTNYQLDLTKSNILLNQE